MIVTLCACHTNLLRSCSRGRGTSTRCPVPQHSLLRWGRTRSVVPTGRAPPAAHRDQLADDDGHFEHWLRLVNTPNRLIHSPYLVSLLSRRMNRCHSNPFAEAHSQRRIVNWRLQDEEFELIHNRKSIFGYGWYQQFMQVYIKKIWLQQTDEFFIISLRHMTFENVLSKQPGNAMKMSSFLSATAQLREISCQTRRWTVGLL